MSVQTCFILKKASPVIKLSDPAWCCIPTRSSCTGREVTSHGWAAWDTLSTTVTTNTDHTHYTHHTDTDTHHTYTDTDTHHTYTDTDTHHTYTDTDTHHTYTDIYHTYTDTHTHHTFTDTDTHHAYTDTDTHHAYTDTDTHHTYEGHTFTQAHTSNASATSCSPPFKFLQLFIKYFTSNIRGKYSEVKSKKSCSVSGRSWLVRSLTRYAKS